MVQNVIGADSAGPPTYAFYMSLHSVTPSSPPPRRLSPLPQPPQNSRTPTSLLYTYIARVRVGRQPNGFGGRPTRSAADRVNATDSHCTITPYNATRVMRAAHTVLHVYNVIIPWYYTTVEPVGSRSLLLHHRCSQQQHHRRHGRRQGWTKCARGGAFGRQYTSNRVCRRSLGRVTVADDESPRTENVLIIYCDNNILIIYFKTAVASHVPRIARTRNSVSGRQTRHNNNITVVLLYC